MHFQGISLYEYFYMVLKQYMLHKNVYNRYLPDMKILFEIFHKGIVILIIDADFGHFIHSLVLILYVCWFVLLLFICTNIVLTYINTLH